MWIAVPVAVAVIGLIIMVVAMSPVDPARPRPGWFYDVGKILFAVGAFVSTAVASYHVWHL